MFARCVNSNCSWLWQKSVELTSLNFVTLLQQSATHRLTAEYLRLGAGAAVRHASAMAVYRTAML